MISPLESLSGPGKSLRKEPPDAKEFEGLKRSGLARLADAGNAAHALCLAALRRLGYRATSRYIVFQVIPHTLWLGPEVWRVLAKCHDIRNLGEYEGNLGVDERIVADLIAACRAVAAKLGSLPPPT